MSEGALRKFMPHSAVADLAGRMPYHFLVSGARPALGVQPTLSQMCTAIASAADEAVWLRDVSTCVDTHGREAVAGWTAGAQQGGLVHHAARLGHAQALALLAQMGFNINAQTAAEEATPLHLAAENNQLRAAEKLVALKVDRSIQNSHGRPCGKAYDLLAAKASNIIWMDCEFTSGFYDEAPARLLEVAIVITSKNLDEVDRGHWVLGGFSKQELLALPPFHQATFCDAAAGGPFPPPTPGAWGNGLFAEVMESKLTLEAASAEMLALLSEHCLPRACPLAGNSIQCDREVISRELPAVYRYLNHRIIDVSSFTGVAERWLPKSLDAYKRDQEALQIESTAHGGRHRALEDVEASIRGLAWVRQNLLVPPPAAKYVTAAMMAWMGGLVATALALIVQAVLSA